MSFRSIKHLNFGESRFSGGKYFMFEDALFEFFLVNKPLKSERQSERGEMQL